MILVVVVLNAGFGFYQEHRAEATLAALKQMLARHARVRRDDVVLQVDAEELVPGDIVLLEAGDRVPSRRALAGRPQRRSGRSGFDRRVAGPMWASTSACCALVSTRSPNA